MLSLILFGLLSFKSVSALEVENLFPEQQVAPIRKIGPIDHRTQVGASSAAYDEPFKYMGWILSYRELTDEPGNKADESCSGTLINARQILTAAHCVYDKSTNRYYARFSFYPAAPAFGAKHTPIRFYKGTSAHVPAEYISNSGYSIARDYDFAIINLNSYTSLGSARLDVVKSDSDTFDLFLAGYPGDKPNQTLWVASSSQKIVFVPGFRNVFYHRIDMIHGESGGPIYYIKNGKAYIIGVNTSEDQSVAVNYGVALTESSMPVLKALMKQ